MKYGFEHNASIQKMDKRNFVLLEDLVFTFGDLKIIVPKGFKTDLASFRIGNLQLVGDTLNAAILHDYLYYLKRYSRFFADVLFHQALILDKTSRFKAFLYYSFVRALGWRFYGKR